MLDGATHQTFSGRNEGAGGDLHDVVALGVVLFFDAYLSGDAEALRTLREEFPQGLAVGDLFEFK